MKILLKRYEEIFTNVFQEVSRFEKKMCMNKKLNLNYLENKHSQNGFLF